MNTNTTALIGGGLAGSECAWQLAQAGQAVVIFEMKGTNFSPAHKNENLGELVCSNSFRACSTASGSGLLQHELTQSNSLIMQIAEKTRLPAGKALAVDRDKFTEKITQSLEQHPNIKIIRQEITDFKALLAENYKQIVIATGPLTSSALAESLSPFLGDDNLYFYDAIAPIVSYESIDMEHAFWGSRYDPETPDYLNCPLDEEQYRAFVQALIDGEKVPAHNFEKEIHFEGCLPVEVMAQRGEMTLAFGPLKPVGLINPSGKPHFAVMQLRAENAEKTAFNLVGFQTKLTYAEQNKIFRMIPALKTADFLRFGSIHRNTYVNSPKILTDKLELCALKNVYLAGQITGVEGYIESTACGLWLGKYLAGTWQEFPPCETALGALLNHLRIETKNFQPSNINFGLFPNLEGKKIRKKDRKAIYAERAIEIWQKWIKN